MSAPEDYREWETPRDAVPEAEAIIPAGDLVRGRRTKTVSVKRLSKRDLLAGRDAYPDEGQHDARPRTRAECPPPGEACPWVSCKHHLYLDVNDRTGSIKLNYPDLEVWELPVSCALEVADRGGVTLEEVGEMMNLTRERVRQLETRALGALSEEPVAQAWADTGREPGDDAPRGEVVEVKTWGRR